MDLVIGIGDYGVSCNKGDALKTYALASCVALVAYHPIKQVAGLIHIALPSPPSMEKGKLRPYYYAASGIPLMLNMICLTYGCRKEELLIRIYGGADSTQEEDYFKIGPRNVAAVHHVLQDMDLIIKEEQTGGTESRSLIVDVASGLVSVIKQPLHFI